jgi:hypothetical protein
MSPWRGFTDRQEVNNMPHQCRRFDDDQAHQRALRELASVAGTECLSRVCWDPVHHLQGHVDVRGEHLVVIAPRDDEHEPLVLSEADWDALRRGRLATA